ncbi:expressed protein, partial [Phakopsora pachyrhizi]
MNYKNAQHLNLDEKKGPDLINNVEIEQNSKNILMQKKQKPTEHLINFQPKKKLNTSQKFTGNIQPSQSTKEDKKLAIISNCDDDTLKMDNIIRPNRELGTTETPHDLEYITNNLANIKKESLKFNIPDKYLPLYTDLENFVQKFPKPPTIENECKFINKALLYMEGEKKIEILNYALECFFSIAKIPCMSSKENFLKAVFDKQKMVLKEKAKKGATFKVARTFYAKQMRPIDFILKIDKRWTFSTVTAEIQAQLGLKLLMKSGFSSLPEKETKALKVTYKKLTE